MLSGSINSTFVELWRIFSLKKNVCSQSGCNRLLTIQIDLRPSAGHLGWSYSTSNLNFDNSILFYLANFQFYSILFCIFYSVFYSILLYNSLLCSILYSILLCILFYYVFYSILSCSLFYSILFCFQFCQFYHANSQIL